MDRMKKVDGQVESPSKDFERDRKDKKERQRIIYAIGQDLGSSLGSNFENKERNWAEKKKMYGLVAAIAQGRKYTIPEDFAFRFSNAFDRINEWPKEDVDALFRTAETSLMAQGYSREQLQYMVDEYDLLESQS